ncbi:MAG: archease [Thermodesulfobacteriota bacterium]
MRRAAFRLLPHTADLRVEVRAPDFPSLCARSVEAVFSLLTDRRRVRRVERRAVSFPPGSPEELLLSVLRRALLLFSLDRYLVRDADANMEGENLVLSVEGEPSDASRHVVSREIKAVTAHALTVECGPPGYTARFLLDV